MTTIICRCIDVIFKLASFVLITSTGGFMQIDSERQGVVVLFQSLKKGKPAHLSLVSLPKELSTLEQTFKAFRRAATFRPRSWEAGRVGISLYSFDFQNSEGAHNVQCQELLAISLSDEKKAPG